MMNTVTNRIILCLCLFFFLAPVFAADIAVDDVSAAWTHEETGKGAQFSHFPHPLPSYAATEAEMTLGEKLSSRIEAHQFNIAVTLVFLCAIIHTFLAPIFQKMAHHSTTPWKSKLFHILGEIELIFGMWVIPFAVVCLCYYSPADLFAYVARDTSYTEPLFVAVIMIIAASRPVYRLAENMLGCVAKLGNQSPTAWWLSVLTIAPFLGSFITEAAAMTLAAIILSKKVYSLKPKASFAYATLGLLFVNISVGGTLTHFAAPPIVMIAGKWGWGIDYMMINFGWKAMLGIGLANALYYMLFRKYLAELNALALNHAKEELPEEKEKDAPRPLPLWIYGISIAFLVYTVYYAHYPVFFLSGFAVFLAYTLMTGKHQDKLEFRIPLLVAFFLAGLLILGGVQGWWMQPVLQALAQLGEVPTMAVATILTAFNDNAAVTFLASTVPNLPEAMKYAIVAGAVTGGGLTVIANAPNLAGQSILSKHFPSINALHLALWALLPTVIMFAAFILL